MADQESALSARTPPGLRVGSLYGHGFDREQRVALEAMGFVIRPQVALYAGSQQCHFIDFPAGPALELIDVTDRSDYEAFVPPGMTPYCPGISLVAGDGSPAGLDAYERAFAGHEPYRLRVPYPGQAWPGAPGWHYLNFARPVVPGTFIWLTALDLPAPVTDRETRHPNGVLGVAGLVFDLPDQEFAGLAELAGQPLADGALWLGDVTFMATGTGGSGSRFPLRTVVLRAEELDRVAALAPNASPEELMGRPALRIWTNQLAWDLLVTG